MLPPGEYRHGVGWTCHEDSASHRIAVVLDVVRLSKCPTRHIVSVCTAPIKDGGTVPRVDIYVTFTGPYRSYTVSQKNKKSELMLIGRATASV